MRFNINRFDYLDGYDLVVARLLIEGYTKQEIADALLVNVSKIKRSAKRMADKTRQIIQKTDFFDEF